MFSFIFLRSLRIPRPLNFSNMEWLLPLRKVYKPNVLWARKPSDAIRHERINNLGRKCFFSSTKCNTLFRHYRSLQILQACSMCLKNSFLYFIYIYKDTMSSTENTICRSSYQQQDSPFTLNSFFNKAGLQEVSVQTEVWKIAESTHSSPF